VWSEEDVVRAQRLVSRYLYFPFGIPHHCVDLHRLIASTVTWTVLDQHAGATQSVLTYEERVESLLEQRASIEAECVDWYVSGRMFDEHGAPRTPEAVPQFQSALRKRFEIDQALGLAARTAVTQILRDLAPVDQRPLLRQYLLAAIPAVYKPADIEVVHRSCLARPELTDSERDALRSLFDSMAREDDLIALDLLNAATTYQDLEVLLGLGGDRETMKAASRDLVAVQDRLRTHRQAWEQRLNQIVHLPGVSGSR
jgi:hypothetical protein